MRNKISLFVLLFLILTSASFAAPKQDIAKLQRELQLLKGYLNNSRDSLQEDIANRWSKKQRYVNQREVDKEELNSLRSKQEREVNQLSRLKEECFAKERAIEDENKALGDRKDEWNYLLASMEEIFDKEQKRISSAMPLDMEKDRALLSSTERDFAKKKKPIETLKAAIDYYTIRSERAGKVTITKEIIMPDDGDPQAMNIVRFGDIVAYALNDAGTPYIIRQTGKMNSGRYTVEKIGSDLLVDRVTTLLPQWVESKSVTQPVLMDVMQNANSAMLISGEKVTASTKIAIWFKAGGPIMIPMVGLFIWAILLVIIKFIQYTVKFQDFGKTSKQVLGYLKSGEEEKALTFAKKKKGVVAKVVQSCLEHSKWTRSSAEKAVKEILLEEVPKLNKSLATLGVIAGAAPMLGLLGTVTGMINLFEVITHYGTGDPKILAGGISEALITTQTGLAVAIPILLLHNYLVNRSNHIQAEMQKHAVRILNRLWPVEG